MTIPRSDERARQPVRAPEGEPSLGERVAEAVLAAQQRLLELQAPDGHWCAELEGDSILESEYLLALLLLGRRPEEPKLRGLAETLRRTQLPGGGWAIYPGGPPDANPTVKAYFALKLMGEDPGAPHMERARATARGLGGLAACNSFTRIYLAIFGQVDWDDCPAVPPELVLLPTWLPFNLYEMSAWSRAIVVPLSLVWALRPSCSVPEGAGLDELRVESAAPRRPPEGWARCFAAIDAALRLAERLRLRPLRRLAIARAAEWVRQRLEASDGLGAIFPPILNTIVAFHALGRSGDEAVVAGQLAELERLELTDGEAVWIQPCFSAVWDTALALQALVESGVPASDGRLRQGARWLAAREVRRPGDWRVKCPEGEPGGWYFEYANEFYPDCDDTAQVIVSLAQLALPAEEAAERDAQLERARRWLLAMQCSRGGWGSFDKDCDRELLTRIPFADHNAMIDPPTVDVTSRVLDALASAGTAPGDPAMRRAVAFVLEEQEPDGSWYGRWGCNHLYGTWLALCGLERAGADTRGSAWAMRARRWLLRCQNADGGWGELPASYVDPAAKGRGPSTASQTAWALLGLLATGEDGEAVERGVRYLLDRQGRDGGWQEEFWTGTGFPGVFYLRYHLYATYFPLLALGRWRRSQGAAGSSSPKLSA
jgi:squalene-hopene/tetraprenyl-beta-curcumene cyclase